MAPMWMMTWLPLVAGGWMVLIGLWMSTANFRSMLFAKAFPVVAGLLSLYAACVNLGWLTMVTTG